MSLDPEQADEQAEQNKQVLRAGGGDGGGGGSRRMRTVGGSTADAATAATGAAATGAAATESLLNYTFIEADKVSKKHSNLPVSSRR